MYSNVEYTNINKPLIAMYGGSFNPIHTGHIQLAKYFLDELKLDKLLLIPDNKPPHKSDSEMVSPLHRYNMCSLAVEDTDKIEVSDIEIRREGKSYTVDTLKQLSNIYPTAQLFLIMGADMYLSLHTWRNFQKILEYAIICAVPRDTDSIDELIKYSASLEENGAKYIISNKSMMNVSSTSIRENIKKGNPITGMVGSKVENYIFKNSLYSG